MKIAIICVGVVTLRFRTVPPHGSSNKTRVNCAMPHRCMYMAHVCFYICCSDCVGVCGNVCCVAPLVKIVFLSLGVLKYVCVRGVVDVVFLFVL